MALFSCEKDEIITQSESNDSQELLETRSNATVPFKGEYSVHTITFEPCGDYDAYMAADGKATHLGKSFWESCASTDFSSPIFSNECSDNVGFIQNGSLTFTAADGSRLFGNFIGTFDFVVGCGDYTITHGDGRFEGATGEGVYEYFNISDGPNPIEFEGTLTNP